MTVLPAPRTPPEPAKGSHVCAVLGATPLRRRQRPLAVWAPQAWPQSPALTREPGWAEKWAGSHKKG